MNSYSRGLLFGALMACAFCATPACAQPDDLSVATAALEDGIPEVAAVRLETLLASNPAPDVKRVAMEKLGEALVAASRFDEALRVGEDAQVRETEHGKFLRAQALAGLDRWTEALQLYQDVARAPGSDIHAEALMGAATAMRATSRTDEALQTIAALFNESAWKVRAQLMAIELSLDKRDLPAANRLLEETEANSAAERKQRRFLRGRIEALASRPGKAVELFESIVRKPEGATRAVLLASLFALADEHKTLKTPEAGDDFLEDFIEHHPADPALAGVFAKLDGLYSAERKPSRRELARWANDPAQPRRSFAQWHLARMELRAGRRDNARAIFGNLAAHPAPDRELAGALLEFAQLEMQDRRWDEAIVLLQQARGLNPRGAVLQRVEFEKAKAQYEAGHYEAAANEFETIARAIPSGGPESLFNASLASLRLNQRARFLTDAREFAERSGGEEGRAELALQQGLLEAARGDKKAADSLRAFVHDFPRSLKASEGWTALAELAYHATPPRLDEARQDLARMGETRPTSVAMERADYLRIWLEDDKSDENVVRLANEFLDKYPASSLAADVRMKLGEAAYRRQDFATAQTQFEILAQQKGESPLLEKALFFAGESALQSMGAHSLDRALELFDEVVKRGGELKWPARMEQAAIERKLGRSPQAITLYDEILRGEAKAGEKREALCAKGDIILETAGANPDKYKQAAELFDELAAPADTPAHWRNQALFKKGTCLEKLNDRAHALETFYRVVEAETSPGKTPEFFWFYKAGFNGARLLEDDQKWESAAALYQKLANAGGARSDEARARLSRLRLEHFLWGQ